jgi:hypothetical protein
LSQYELRRQTLDAGRIIFCKKKPWKYCDGVLKYFTTFAQEKLPKNKTYFANILVQITVKKLTLFSIIFLEYFASFIIFLTHWMQEGLFFSKKS